MKKILLLSVLCVLSAPAAYAQTYQNNPNEPKIYNTPSTNVTNEQIDAAQQIYNTMTPQQKTVLADEVHRQAGTMAPEHKAAIIKRAKEYYKSLSPKEKADLKVKLAELGSKMTKADREAYLSQLD